MLGLAFYKKLEPIKIMKLFSLQLPENADGNGLWRWRKKGHKRIGFLGSALVTQNSDGTTTGVSDFATGDVASANITTTSQAISTRFVIFSGRTAATAATIPAASGTLRELIIQNVNSSSGAVTITSPSTNIFSTANASAQATNVIAITTVARYLSDGTSWFRVQ